MTSFTVGTPGAADRLLQQADQATREGRLDDAVTLLNRVLASDPGNVRALNALGNRALARGDFATARRCFEHAAAGDPQAAAIWLNLATALRLSGDAAGELVALDRALEVDPYFIIALLQKGQWFERHGHAADAARAYRALLDAVPDTAGLTPAFRAALDQARALVEAEDARMAAAIRAAVGEPSAGSRRFDHAMEILGGHRRIYLPQPAGLHYPYLPPVQFFDRDLFPWFQDLEAAAPAIREEVLALAMGDDLNRPYVSIAAGQPANQWQTLNNSLNWSAVFLWRNGEPVRDVLDRCPATAMALAALPLLDIPERGPTAMFSTLRPRTHIPPHHGVTNIRTVVHLPLVVPEGCRFRVGSETRPWLEGAAWAFDDTIEHEAWNDGDETRIVLIIDAWNPYLDEEERHLLRTAHEAMADFGDRV